MAFTPLVPKRDIIRLSIVYMKYYTDGFMIKSNPSPIGGGYTVTDEIGNVIHQEVIKKEGLTNNEAETRGILHALRIAEIRDSISTDSMCCITWINKGRAKVRPDLTEILQEAKRLIKEKTLNLCWEAREFNLAGIHNETNMRKYDNERVRHAFKNLMD